MSETRSPVDPLKDARALQASIDNLKALLNLQLRQVEQLNARLYEDTAGGSAARRLMAVKQAERR